MRVSARRESSNSAPTYGSIYVCVLLPILRHRITDDYSYILYIYVHARLYVRVGNRALAYNKCTYGHAFIDCAGAERAGWLARFACVLDKRNGMCAASAALRFVVRDGAPSTHYMVATHLSDMRNASRSKCERTTKQPCACMLMCATRCRLAAVALLCGATTLEL